MAFKNTKKAIEHINNIWSNPTEWWNSNEVKKILKSIRHNFCKTDTNSIDIWKNFIKNEYKSLN